MSIHPTPLPVVCALLEYTDDQGQKHLWVAQRSDSQHHGQWEFPGGKVEPDELPSEALHREIQEELHCQIQIREVYPYNDHDYGQGKLIRLMPFLCTPIGTPTKHVHTALKSVTAQEAQTLTWAPADIPILNYWLERNNTPVPKIL